MATITQFTFCSIDSAVPTPDAMSAVSTTTITPTGSNQQTSGASTAGTNVCRVATDTAVYVTFGANPDATGSTRFLLPAGCIEYFRVRQGDKGAVVLA